MNSSEKNNGRRKYNFSTMNGWIPPQNVEVEKMILGTCLMNPDAFLEAKRFVVQEDFYDEFHRDIFEAMGNCIDGGSTIDPIMIAQMMIKNGKAAMTNSDLIFSISKITDSANSAAHIEKYCRVIQEYSMKRKVITFSSDVIANAYNEGEDAFDILSEAQNFYSKITTDIQSTVEKKMTDHSLDFLNKVSEKMAGKVPQVKSGLKSWDDVNGAFEPGTIYVVAARPGMGKTDFAVECMVRMAANFPISFFSLEMPIKQIQQRFISNLMKVDNWLFKKPHEQITEEDFQAIVSGIELLNNLDLYLEDLIFEIHRICDKIRFHCRKYGVQVFWLDYLQIIQCTVKGQQFNTNTDRINYALNMLFQCVKEEGCTLILLSQLNRENVKRNDKKPNLSDLSGSGMIEQVAYQIAFLHRPEYYGEKEDAFGDSTIGKSFLIIEKHRGGKTGEIPFYFKGQYSSYEEISTNPFEKKYDMKDLDGFGPSNTINSNQEMPF